MNKLYMIPIVLLLGIGLSVSVEGQENLIPSWIKNISEFWANDQVSDTEFINALQFMMTNNIIQIPTQTEIVEDLGDFYVTYDQNPNSVYDFSARDWIINSEYFEVTVAYLNETFRLPYDVEILLTECNEANAFYDFDLKQIIICYEFIDSTYSEFSLYWDEDLLAGNITTDDINNTTLDVVDFIFYHELGHALIDVHSLPITGLEENVVDQFATLTMLLTEDPNEYGGIIGQDILYNIGTWFLIQTELYEQSSYWDVHNLDIQRFYNISCYAYGQNPDYNQDLIDEGSLPLERAEDCHFEYSMMEKGWNNILSSYYK